MVAICRDPIASGGCEIPAHPSQAPAYAEVNDSLPYVYALGDRIIERLRRADFRAHENAAEQEALPALQAELRVVLTGIRDAANLLSTIPTLLGKPPETAFDKEAFELDFDLTPPAPGERRPTRVHSYVNEVDDAFRMLVAPSAAREDVAFLHNLCNVLLAEVWRCVERLRDTNAALNKWHLIVEGEEASRKGQNALRTALCAVARVFDPPQVQRFNNVPTEQQTALEVRRCLLSLRRDVLAITRVDDTSSPKPIIHQLLIRLDALPREAAYHKLRALDCHEIHRLCERLRAWVAGDMSGDEGWQVIADARAFVELLRHVNNREVLIESDRRLRQYGLDTLNDLQSIMGVAPRRTLALFARLLTKLEDLQNRDEAFDSVLAAERVNLRCLGEACLERMSRMRAALENLRI